MSNELDITKIKGLSDRKKQLILEDCTDATPDEVKVLVTRLYQLHRPELAKKMQVKYSHLLSYKQYDKIVNAGISYESCERDSTNCSSVYVDGLTFTQWRALNDDTYVPSNIAALRRILAALRRSGKGEIAEAIAAKYKYLFDAQQEKYAEKYEIPDDIPYSQIGEEHRICRKVDGIPLYRWKLLHDPNYIPSKTHLIQFMKYFEGNGEDDVVLFLMDKYESILDAGEPEPSLSLAEANAVLSALFSPDYKSRYVAELRETDNSTNKKNDEGE